MTRAFAGHAISAPIYCWREPIDDKFFAAIAECVRIHRGDILGLSVFILCDRSERWHYQDRDTAGMWRWEFEAALALRKVVREQHQGELPYIGPTSIMLQKTFYQ